MKNRRLLAISSLFLAAIVSAGAARRAAANTEVDPGTAFSRLKALVGEWDVESSSGKAHSRFELIARGSVLLEHFTEPGGQEMLTAYHLDGSRLVLTHYCVAGNQPQMVAEKFDGASGELDFAFAGGSNIAPGAGHMHDAVFHLGSNDHFDAKWDFVEAGKVKFSEEIHYTRTK
ncbi:MAG TPA: hypothetical protein VIX37_07965 [Candidatus Sulfotelmatobacter sp.]